MEKMKTIDLRKKFNLILTLGETGCLSEQETSLMLESNGDGRNLFLFSQIGPNIGEIWDRAFPSDDEKILSFKGIVLLEKIDEENGGVSTGSTTVTAYICRRIIELGLDSDELMDFVLSNKSTNPWTPFGGFSHVKSYREFKECQNLGVINQLAHENRQREAIEQKKETNLQKQREHRVRIFKRQEQNTQKYDAVISYFEDSNRDLLNDILNRKLPFPLPLIPQEEIDRISKNIPDLDFETVVQLLQIIPRRSSEKLRVFRQKLNSQRKKNIN